MSDPRAGTHNLNIARLCAADIAKAVLVGDRTFAHISDNFHVGMAMGIKASAGGNLVIIPHPDCAPLGPLWVMIVAKGEMMAGVEPAILKAAQTVELAFLNHNSTFHFLCDFCDADAIEAGKFAVARGRGDVGCRIVGLSGNTNIIT